MPSRRTLSIWLLAVLLPVCLVLGVRAYRQWNDFKEADRCLNEATLLLHQGKTEEAIPLLERSVALCPDMVGSIDALASCYEDRGSFDKAVAILSEATARVSSPQLLRQLGTAHSQLGHHREAAAAYAAAFRLEPDNLILDKLRIRAEKRAQQQH